MINREDTEVSKHDLEMITRYLFLQKEIVIDRIINANTDRGLALADQQMREIQRILDRIKTVILKRNFREIRERSKKAEENSRLDASTKI